MSDYKNYTFIEILKKSGEIKTVEDALLYIDKNLVLKNVCGGDENTITDDYIHRLLIDISNANNINDSLFVSLITDCCLKMNKDINDMLSNVDLLNQESHDITQHFNNSKIDNKLINDNFIFISEKIEVLENKTESCIQKNNIDDIIKRLEFLENKNEKLIQKNNYLAKKIDRLTKRLPVDIINIDNDSLDNELIEDFIVF